MRVLANATRGTPTTVVINSAIADQTNCTTAIDGDGDNLTDASITDQLVA